MTQDECDKLQQGDIIYRRPNAQRYVVVEARKRVRLKLPIPGRDVFARVVRMNGKVGRKYLVNPSVFELSEDACGR